MPKVVNISRKSILCLLILLIYTTIIEIKKHIWKPGEKCMAPWNDGFYKGEIKHSIPKHKTISVWFELFDVLEDFYINEIHPRHFFTNGDAGQFFTQVKYVRIILNISISVFQNLKSILHKPV